MSPGGGGENPLGALRLLSALCDSSSPEPRLWTEGRNMRKLIAALVAVGALTVVGVGPAFGAEHHPPKFGPHDTQCQSGANQPNCPGGH
jgi:hypothetical protein